MSLKIPNFGRWVRDAELGKRFADALVKVTLIQGVPRLIYVHIEIQGQRDDDFTRRMFTYNYSAGRVI